MKVVTYATHSEGTFEELTKNGDVVVLGFGEKWEGFIGKAKSIIAYLDTQPDEEIIVVVDGFDSVINKNLDNLEEDFTDLDCKVLYSLDGKFGLSHIVPGFVNKYWVNKIYGTCRDGVTANAGLYMGYCKYLKIVLSKVIQGDSDDDQRNLNKLCTQFPFLKVDVDNVIFENCLNKDEPSNAYFKQIPGTFTFNRTIRTIKEYSKYFIPEIILFFVLVWWFLERIW